MRRGSLPNQGSPADVAGASATSPEVTRYHSLVEPRAWLAEALRYAVAGAIVVATCTGLTLAFSRGTTDEAASEVDSAVIIDLPPADASSQPASSAAEGPEQQAVQASPAQQAPEQVEPPKPVEELKPVEDPKPVEPQAGSSASARHGAATPRRARSRRSAGAQGRRRAAAQTRRRATGTRARGARADGCRRSDDHRARRDLRRGTSTCIETRHHALAALPDAPARGGEAPDRQRPTCRRRGLRGVPHRRTRGARRRARGIEFRLRRSRQSGNDACQNGGAVPGPAARRGREGDVLRGTDPLQVSVDTACHAGAHPVESNIIT